MSEPEFSGLRGDPQENWFKMPNEWTDIVCNIKSMAELKIYMYVIRHTWGFSEYDMGKRITLDEFENGRKRKDGSRLDKGTGLSRPTIVDGLRKAVKHGYLEVQTDSRDGGRVKKFYKVRIADAGVKFLNPGSKEKQPQTLGNTTPIRERHLLKDTCRKKGAVSSNGQLRRGLLFTEFDEKASKHIQQSIIEDSPESDLARARLDTIAKRVFRLRTERNVSEDRIKQVFKWWRQFHDDEFTPKLFKANDIVSKFTRIEEAMKRHEADLDKNGDSGDAVPEPGSDRYGLINKIRDVLIRDHQWEMDQQVFQDEVNEALKELGLEPDSVLATEV